MGALSNGRIALTYYSYCFMSMALTIAVRYAAVRKQFGATPGNEQSIIEYQLHVTFINFEFIIKEINYNF